MSVTSGFFNSVNGDRKYDAQQMSSIFDGIINDGVFASIGTAFSVQATTGNTVTVGTGRAWFDHAWLLNDSTLPIELDDAEVLLDRIDAIVIEINHSETVRAGSIKVINGTPSSTPANPTMTHTDYINQYPIAYIMRSANSSAITQANIIYMVGSDACPFITGLLSVVSIQNIVAQWESEFDTWLDSLSAMLDDNTAANLANQILELKEQFDTLAREKKIYSELEDSTGDDTIDDSTGNPILGTTSMYSDEGSSESIPVATGGDPYKVGDILTTARTDLGAKWLLCNGDELDRDLYSELANVIPHESDLNGTWDKSLALDGKRSEGFIYQGGYYVLAYGDTNSSVYISYSTSVEGPWTSKEIVPNSQLENATNLGVYGIKYLNGMYVVFGIIGYRGFYAYSDSLNGTWTAKRFGSDTIGVIHDVEYLYNAQTQTDVWLIAGEGSTNAGANAAVVAVGNSLSSVATFSLKTLSTSISNSYTAGVSGLTYKDDTLVAVGYTRESSENQVEYTIWTSSNFGSSWTKSSVLDLETPSYFIGYPPDVCHINGMIVAFWFNGQKGSINIAYSEDTTEAWTEKTVTSEASAIGYMTYADGKYILSAEMENLCILYSSSLDGSWTSKSLDENSISPGPGQIVYINGAYAIMAKDQKSSSVSAYSTFIYHVAPGEIFLPSISLSDKTYTYIRAKE